MRSIFLILGIFIQSFSQISAKELTVENVYESICDYYIFEPEYVLAQTCLETGWFKSYNCKVRNNLFGFRSKKWVTEDNKNGYKVFSSWEASVDYYKRWQIRKGYHIGENYLKFLKNVGYAEDPNYESKVKLVLKRLREKHGIQ